MTHGLVFRRATPADAPRMEAIRAAAFASVFASLRAILGEKLYAIVQARDDEAQASMLASMLAQDAAFELFVAEQDGEVRGFVSMQLDAATAIGEVGLNAVDPQYGGRGIGTAMYRFAIDRMRESGMKAATVSTGGDPSHAPARQAYCKAGFTAQIPSVWMCQLLRA